MAEQEKQLYLASTSPRRQTLLAQIGIRFDLLPQHVDESRRVGEHSEAYVQRLALEKARAGKANMPSSGPVLPVLGADTIVVCDGQILGKPVDQAQAFGMWRLLSNRSHQVFTAVALIDGDAEISCISETTVTFRAIDEQEMLKYWQSGEPADKAGAYGIQGYGAVFVVKLTGSYSGVVGLPLYETHQLLQRGGVVFTSGNL